MRGIIIPARAVGISSILLPNLQGVVYSTLRQVYGVISVSSAEIVMSYTNATASSTSGFYLTVDLSDYNALEFALKIDEITPTAAAQPAVGVFNTTPINNGIVEPQFLTFKKPVVSPTVVTYTVDISGISGNKIIGMYGGTKGKCVGISLRT